MGGHEDTAVGGGGAREDWDGEGEVEGQAARRIKDLHTQLAQHSDIECGI